MGVGHPFILFRSIYPVPVCYQVHTIGTEYGIIGTRRFDLVPPVLTADMTKGPVFFVSARVKKKKKPTPKIRLSCFACHWKRMQLAPYCTGCDAPPSTAALCRRHVISRYAGPIRTRQGCTALSGSNRLSGTDTFSAHLKNMSGPGTPRGHTLTVLPK